MFLCCCSGSKVSNHGEEDETATKDDRLINYEKSFDPGKYDLGYEENDIISMKSYSKEKRKSAPKKIVSGFRIQTTISGEASDCQRSRIELQKLFPDLKTYIIHEFPFYKLRIGDFTSKKDAENFMKILIEKDIRSGLIVPDKIIAE